MRIKPFNSGTQDVDWCAANCDRCIKSFNNGGKCEIEDVLTEACFGDGHVGSAIAQRMGYQAEVYIWQCPELCLIE